MAKPLDNALVRAIQEYAGTVSYREIGRLLGVSDSTVRKYAVNHITPQVEADHLADRVPGDYMNQVKIGLVEEPIVLELDEDFGPLMVIADVHVPLFSVEWFNRMLDKAEEVGAKNVVIVGDWWNKDALSNYYPKQENAGLKVEQRVGEALMGLLLRKFDKVYISKGNHDYRVVKHYGYAFSFVQAMRESFKNVPGNERIQYTNLDHIVVDGPGFKNPWYLAHADRYNGSPLVNARKLADLKKMNVATAHSHHAAIGYSAGGHYVAVEMGGLFDKDRTEYLNASTTYANWQNAFGYIDLGGKFHLVTEEWET